LPRAIFPRADCFVVLPLAISPDVSLDEDLECVFFRDRVAVFFRIVLLDVTPIQLIDLCKRFQVARWRTRVLSETRHRAGLTLIWVLRRAYG
jgi:hypothetical protein